MSARGREREELDSGRRKKFDRLRGERGKGVAAKGGWKVRDRRRIGHVGRRRGVGHTKESRWEGWKRR